MNTINYILLAVLFGFLIVVFIVRIIVRQCIKCKICGAPTVRTKRIHVNDKTTRSLGSSSVTIYVFHECKFCHRLDFSVKSGLMGKRKIASLYDSYFDFQSSSIKRLLYMANLPDPKRFPHESEICLESKIT